MTFDPTKNRIVHGLLTDEERAIIETAEAVERYSPSKGEWMGKEPRAPFYSAIVYRAKPEPKMRVVWQNVYPALISPQYSSREGADQLAGPARIAVLRVEWAEDGSHHKIEWEAV